jgi:hypothetical protein
MLIPVIRKMLVAAALWSALAVSAGAGLVSFYWENDFPVPGGRDRWLTNRAVVEFQAGRLGVWTAGTEMYTPDDLRSSEIPVDDSPWDGYSWVGYRARLDNAGRELEVRLGILGGHASGTASLQRLFHVDFGWGTEPKGWGTANPAEAAIDVIYTHSLRDAFDSWLGQVEVTHVYGARAGNVRVAAFLDQEVRKGLWRRGRKFGIYGLAGLDGEARAWTSHLQGRMFHDNIYTVDAIPLVATFRAGIAATLGAWDIRCVYKFTTEEFEGQDARHVYGSLQALRRW